MEKRTLAQIEQEIAETKAALENVHGTETEVYARIVGYYRSVRNWNKGKRDEYNLRLSFAVPENLAEPVRADASECHNETDFSSASMSKAAIASYELFTRATCPHCPAVKQYLADVALSGTHIDVDTDQGLAEAAAKGVLATPTVIFYDSARCEIARAHNTTEIEAVLAAHTEPAASIA